MYKEFGLKEEKWVLNFQRECYFSSTYVSINEVTNVTIEEFSLFLD